MNMLLLDPLNEINFNLDNFTVISGVKVLTLWVLGKKTFTAQKNLENFLFLASHERL